jgi:hypothetical protein
MKKLSRGYWQSRSTSGNLDFYIPPLVVYAECLHDQYMHIGFVINWRISNVVVALRYCTLLGGGFDAIVLINNAFHCIVGNCTWLVLVNGTPYSAAYWSLASIT